MKRIVCILTSIILSVSVFCSCERRKYDTRVVAQVISDKTDFGGVLYSSLANEWEDDYLHEDLLSQMFLSPIPRGVEVTLLIRPSAKVTYEVGVFYTPRSSERLFIIELLSERLSVLRMYDGECLDTLFTKGGYVIYAFAPSADKVGVAVDSMF